MKSLGFVLLTIPSVIVLGLALVAVGKSPKPTIVLVDGAWADGSSWQKVIPILQDDGYTVIPVENPDTSLPDDVVTTKRVIDAQKGPVVVAGHSYAGAVITEAAAGNPNVKVLVYLSGFAPEPGESLSPPGTKFAPAPINSALVPAAGGFFYIDRAKFHDFFCKDLSAADARVLAATQKPVSASVFDAKVAHAAWKTIPSWYIITLQDQAINPELQRFYAKRMGAKITEIKSSHVSFLSHPKEVAKVIEEASRATTQATK